MAAISGGGTTGLGSESSEAIDRAALVSRHNVRLTRFEPLSPVSVGNGEFAFTGDATGLQTFPELYNDAMPLCTMSQWGWHTAPRPASIKDAVFKPTEYDSYGRKVPYITGRTGQEELYNWLRENPHRLHLGQIGFDLRKAVGRAVPADLTETEQRLDLWTGSITSVFRFQRLVARTKVAVHPELDLLAVKVESDLLREGNAAIRIAFPYGSQTMQAADWNSPGKHVSSIVSSSSGQALIRRNLDADEYFVALRWTGTAKLRQGGSHEFFLEGVEAREFEFVVAFSRDRPTRPMPEASPTFAASEAHWRRFWTTGAAVDLSASRDTRAKELERRVVLSQYLTAIQCSGSTPPQETGLTCNSWYGKYHLEMHWWHSAQFALWNRLPLLERSLGWYSKVLSSARARAREQGYAGARWAKMTAPDGRDSPSPIGPLLIWQQPHPIFYAELAYLTRPTAATLLRYRDVVLETAAFMADYAHFDDEVGRYILGPPVIPAQENHPPRETWNPTYELEYWHWGLKTANLWRQRLGMRVEPRWVNIVRRLSLLPQKDGVYLAHENCPQTFTERNKDHPSMLAALGVLTGEKVARETMRRTLKKVMKEWDWAETWGWDYPMTAMTAARLGEPEMALDALLLEAPKNHYAANGHNYQRPNLPLYLPGNGGLLYAIALMAGGWKGAPPRNAPGFPSDGSWTVRSEGFNSQVLKAL